VKKIGVSYLTQFLKCGEQYFRRQIMKEIIPPGIALLKGSGFHKGAEFNFEEKIKTGADLTADRIIEVSIEEMRSKINKEGILLSTDERTVGQANVVNKAEKSLVVMSGLFADHIAPKHTPKLIEHYVQVPIPGSEWNLNGRIDLINTEDRIVDFKTGSKSPAKNAAVTSVQLTTYGLLYWASFGKTPLGYQLEHCVDKKVPEAVSQSTTRQESDFVALMNTVDTVTKAIDTGSFPPAYGTMGAWYCSPRFCGYWSTCQYVPASRRNEQ
jgi:hypothetical protein